MIVDRSPSNGIPRVPAQPAAIALVFWMLWMSMTSGVVILRTLLLGGKSETRLSGPAGVLDFVCVGLVCAGLMIRWLVVPRVSGALQRRLPFFIAGLALAEASAILSLFLAPHYHAELFIAALLALLTMAPFFALPKSGGNAFRSNAD